MAVLKSGERFWLECDSCGRAGEYMAEHAHDAWSLVEELEWSSDGQKHHCDQCLRLAQCECGQPAGALPGERNDLCQACWDKAMAEDGS